MNMKLGKGSTGIFLLVRLSNVIFAVFVKLLLFRRPGPIDDHAVFGGAYSAPPTSVDRSSRADAYQSPTATADRVSKSSIYQTPTTGFDLYSQPIEQDASSQLKRAPTPRKNFYGDVVEK